MAVGPTLSAEGQVASNVWRAMRMHDTRGANDCGIQSMAGVMGVTPSALLRVAVGGDDHQARALWNHVEQNQMDMGTYANLARAVGAEVTHVSHDSVLRPPQPGQAGVYIAGYESGNHAVCLARSEDGRILYKVDFQQQSFQAYRIDRGQEQRADTAPVTAVLQASGRPIRSAPSGVAAPVVIRVSEVAEKQPATS